MNINYIVTARSLTSHEELFRTPFEKLEDAKEYCSIVENGIDAFCEIRKGIDHPDFKR